MWTCQDRSWGTGDGVTCPHCAVCSLGRMFVKALQLLIKSLCSCFLPPGTKLGLDPFSPRSSRKRGKFCTRLCGGTFWNPKHLDDCRHQRVFLMQLAEYGWGLKAPSVFWGRKLKAVISKSYPFWFKFQNRFIIFLFFFQIFPQPIASNNFAMSCLPSSLCSSPPFPLPGVSFLSLHGTCLAPAALHAWEPPKPPGLLTKETLCWTLGLIRTCRLLGAFLKLFSAQENSFIPGNSRVGTNRIKSTSFQEVGQAKSP